MVQCCGNIKIPDILIGQEMLSCSSGPIRMSGIFILPQHWTNDPASGILAVHWPDSSGYSFNCSKPCLFELPLLLPRPSLFALAQCAFFKWFTPTKQDIQGYWHKQARVSSAYLIIVIFFLVKLVPFYICFCI